MSAAVFLLLMLANLFGVCGGLARLGEHHLNRARDMHLALLLVVLTFGAIAMRNTWIGVFSWAPMVAATLGTYRFVRTANDRTRIRRLGRSATSMKG